MDEETAKMIKERFDALPQMVQDAILSSDYENSLLEIGKKYQLNVDQMAMLEQETTLVMMGLTPSKDFETELTQALNIDKTKVSQIIADINEKVFSNIRELLKLMNTPLGEEPSTESASSAEDKKNADILKSAQIEITPEKPETPTENIMTSRDDMLSKVENPDLINKEDNPTSSALNINSLDKKNEPSIVMQKLSGAFKTPTIKTEYSLPSLAKDKNAAIPTPTSSDVPKVDPYREIPE